MENGTRFISLFELDEHARNIEALLEQEGTEDDEILAGALNQALEVITNDIEKKIDGYALLIRKYDALAELAANEEARAKAFKDGYKNKAKRLKGLLLDFMKARGIQSCGGPMSKFWIQNNGGATPLFVDPSIEADPTKLPERFRRVKVKVEIDTDALRAALEAGEQVEGCSLTERGVHLRMK